MLPEERARKKIDHQLQTAGWDIVSRDEYIPNSASAVKEALMQGNTESDYLFFVDHKAIAVPLSASPSLWLAAGCPPNLPKSPRNCKPCLIRAWTTSSAWVICPLPISVPKLSRGQIIASWLRQRWCILVPNQPTF